MFQTAHLQRPDCRISYTHAGSNRQNPILFLQGVGVQGLCWRPQIEAFADKHFCLTLDNRGMGASPMNAQGMANLTVEQMIDDSLAVLDSAAIDSAHLVGHSLGGLIALGLALQSPKRVRSLTLMCTFARGADATKLTWRMFWLGMATRIGPRKSRRRAFMHIVYPAAYLRTINIESRAAELAELFGHDLAGHPPVVMPQLQAMKKFDATPRLNELKDLPTLILCGNHDPIGRPALARAMAQSIPNAKLHEFPEAAHGLPLQCRDSVNELLADHFSRA